MTTSSLSELTLQVIPLLQRSSQDADPIIRVALLEHLSFFGETHPGLVASHLLPLITSLLMDKNVQVQETAHATLLALCSLLAQDDVIQHVFPTVHRLLDDRGEEDNRVEALMLIRDLAHGFSRQVAVPLILTEITEASKDASFRVRKVEKTRTETCSESEGTLLIH